MCQKIQFILIMAMILFSQNSQFQVSEYVEPGAVDALGPFSENEELLLIQFDLPTDSLISAVETIFPNLNLNTGPGSYQRILDKSQFQQIPLSDSYFRIIRDDYQIQLERNDWEETQWGESATGTGGSVGYTCYCIDGSGCLVVGFNDDWWDPLDYYGDAFWTFTVPDWQAINSVKISIQGMQCDDLPLWESSSVTVKKYDCSWADESWSAMLSLEYTTNTFELPPELFYNIWCNGNLMPVIWSEDNYSVEWIKIEFSYEEPCEQPEAPQNLAASDGEFCDFINISWDAGLNAENYWIFRDSVQIAETTGLFYEDSSALAWEEFEYCVKATNDCGESGFVCDMGFRKNKPATPQNLSASDGENANSIQVTWSDVVHESGYKIFRDNIWIYSLSADATFFEDNNVDAGEIYNYCVSAFNGCGESDAACDEGFAESNEEPFLGDVNGDGILDVLDIIRIVAILLEMDPPPTEYELLSADVNEDGIVNVQDVIQIVSMILET